MSKKILLIMLIITIQIACSGKDNYSTKRSSELRKEFWNCGIFSSILRPGNYWDLCETVYTNSGLPITDVFEDYNKNILFVSDGIIFR